MIVIGSRYISHLTNGVCRADGWKISLSFVEEEGWRKREEEKDLHTQDLSIR